MLTQDPDHEQKARNVSIYPFIHSFIRSFTHSFTQALVTAAWCNSLQT